MAANPQENLYRRRTPAQLVTLAMANFPPKVPHPQVDNLFDDDGRSILATLAIKKAMPQLHWCVGPRVNLPPRMDVNARMPNGQTALFLAEDIGVMQRLIDYGADATVRDNQGYNVLMRMARVCRLDRLEYLLEEVDEFAGVINEVATGGPHAGATALHLAAYAPRLQRREVLEALLGVGASVYLRDGQDRDLYDILRAEEPLDEECLALYPDPDVAWELTRLRLLHKHQRGVTLNDGGDDDHTRLYGFITSVEAGGADAGIFKTIMNNFLPVGCHQRNGLRL